MSDSFSQLSLAPALARAVAEMGYESMTPIQAQAIPVVLQGRDVMGAAQTGTGKTGGFALPILERLFPNGHPDREHRHGPRQPRVLVLTPTRELAAQVHDSFKQYARDLPLVSTDLRGTEFSSVFSAMDTLVLGNLVKVVAWYDNEWGYASRLADITAMVASKL